MSAVRRCSLAWRARAPARAGVLGGAGPGGAGAQAGRREAGLKEAASLGSGQASPPAGKRKAGPGESGIKLIELARLADLVSLLDDGGTSTRPARRQA